MSYHIPYDSHHTHSTLCTMIYRKNYQKLMHKVSNWVKPGGKLFIHIFTHKDFPYHFKDSWMAENFFTGRCRLKSGREGELVQCSILCRVYMFMYICIYCILFVYAICLYLLYAIRFQYSLIYCIHVHIIYAILTIPTLYRRHPPL